MDGDNSTRCGDCPKAKKSKTSREESRAVYPNWAHLPSVVVHEIFSFLDRTDRLSASTVCKNWRPNVFHPRWWPALTFHIDARQMDKARFFISTFGKIVQNATLRINTLSPKCTNEFTKLVEILSDNNNLRQLVIEPTHCHFYPTSVYSHCDSNKTVKKLIASLKRRLPNLTRFSIGCVEDFAYYIDEYLAELSPKKITHLGLASVKDNPNEYEDPYFDHDLLKPFVRLRILSVDYDQMSDKFLRCLDGAGDLERLVVHLHGLRDSHPGTSEDAWTDFGRRHPDCELRLTVIHSYEEIGSLHETVLRRRMPLSHLKVFFCEGMNMSVMESLSTYYGDTLRTLMWVDSLENSRQMWAFMTPPHAEGPDPLVMISWLCKKLEELVVYGYKYTEENLIAIARLKGDRLKRLEMAEDDICVPKDCTAATAIVQSHHENFLSEIPSQLKRPWAPTKSHDLHPVIFNPTSGDSDEYLLPIVLADLH